MAKRVGPDQTAIGTGFELIVKPTMVTQSLTSRSRFKSHWSGILSMRKQVPVAHRFLTFHQLFLTEMMLKGP